MAHAEDVLGHQHSSKPQTKEDKEMSKRHKKNRKLIDKMEDGPEKLRKSIHYNKMHRDEHQKALVMSQKKLSKMR